MKKQVIIVVICLVTVCAVFGLNDRLTYEGLQEATEMVKGSSTEVIEDLQVVAVMATAFKHYSPQKVVEISVQEQTIEDEQGNEKKVYSLVYVSYYENPIASGDLDLTTENWEFTDGNTAEQVRFILEPLTRSSAAPSGDSFFVDVLTALHYIGFYLSLIVSVVMALLVIVCDTVAVVWSLVEAAFYLIGF